MSANAIWYEPKDRKFYFDGFAATVSKLGRLIANALFNREKYVTYAKITVSVNYIEQMLRWKAQYGWFFDITDVTSDHRFDPNRITPGTRWGECEELKRQARGLRQLAADRRHNGDRDSAAGFEDEAWQLMDSYHQRLMPGISGRKFRARA